MKKSTKKKIMACLATLVCLLICGCGNSSKDRIIAVYDYSSSTGGKTGDGRTVKISWKGGYSYGIGFRGHLEKI